VEWLTPLAQWHGLIAWLNGRWLQPTDQRCLSSQEDFSPFIRILTNDIIRKLSEYSIKIMFFKGKHNWAKAQGMNWPSDRWLKPTAND